MSVEKAKPRVLRWSKHAKQRAHERLVTPWTELRDAIKRGLYVYLGKDSSAMFLLVWAYQDECAVVLPVRHGQLVVTCYPAQPVGVAQVWRARSRRIPERVTQWQCAQAKVLRGRVKGALSDEVKGTLRKGRQRHVEPWLRALQRWFMQEVRG